MSPLNACLLIPVVVVYLLLLLDNQVCGDANFAILNNKSLPGKCYMETDKGPLIIESEQLVRHPLKCENIFCGRESWALIFTCSPRSVPQGCVVTDYIDSNAAYPECCERDWICNDIV